MASPGKVSTSQPDDLGWILRTHVVRTDARKSSSDLHMGAIVHTHPHTLK